MEILTITSLFPNKEDPNRGIFVLNRIKAIQKYANIEVIAPIAWFPFVKKNKVRGVPFKKEIEGLTVYHPKFFSIPKFFKFLDGWFFYFSLRKYAKKIKKADIIDSHFAWPDGYGTWLAAKKYNKKFSITLHGSDVNYKLKKKIIKNKIIKMLNNANLIITVSKGLKRVASQYIKKDIKVISNGVDANLFKLIAQKKAREELKLPLNKKIILSVGRPFKLKGFFELVEAAKDLNANIYLIGKDKKKELLNFIKKNNINNVKLIGEVKHKELYKWYSSADIFILVSHSEGWPCSVMEALACGKPCVVTEEAAGEFITKDLGIVTDYKDLSKNLKKALDKKWDTKKILKFAKKNSWDKTTKNVLNNFNELLNKNDG